MVAIFFGLLLTSMPGFQATPVIRQSPDELVQALSQFRAALQGVGMLSPSEHLRYEIYDRLLSLGPIAVPALCQGLADSDVQVRRNVALFLAWQAGRRQHLEINPCVPWLVRSLADTDGRVRELAAQAVGATGAEGVSAVPALIGLLGSSSEGDRNTACIGLAGIGAAAKEALPALKKALSDPSANVRSFCRAAIERIQRQQLPN